MTPQQALEKAIEAAGGTRAKLARLLGITMQAVAQWDEAPAGRVLEIERLTGVSRHDLRPDIYPRESEYPELAEPKHAWRSEPQTAEMRSRAPYGGIPVQPDGSAIVPKSVMAEAGLHPGDFFVADVAGEGDVRLVSGAAGLRRAQELVRRYVPKHVSLVDELIEERRREVEKFEHEIESGNE